MIKIFSTDKVRELDKYTIQNEPISSIDLVERAATVFTSEFCRRYSKQTRIIVFAGQGNNGADALAIARMLTDAGYRVETYLFNPTMRLSDDCELNKQRLLHMEKIEFTEVVDDFVPPELEERDVVIDGLFGSGLNRPLTGGFAAMVRYINQSDATVVAIDIPSGLFGEDNRKNDPDAIIHDQAKHDPAQRLHATLQQSLLLTLDFELPFHQLALGRTGLVTVSIAFPPYFPRRRMKPAKK